MAQSSVEFALPAELGFKMPAEWEPHEATWLAWPHNAEDWPGKFQTIPWIYAEIVRLLSLCEQVHILVNNAVAERRARRVLERNSVRMEAIHFHVWPTNRVWTRDSGPIFIRTEPGQLGITDWRFNAWAKYPDWELDDQLPGRVQQALGLPLWQPVVSHADGRQQRLVLEGGSIDTNGAGALLTTEECLLSEVQQRNPGVSRGQMEQAFHDYLGIEQVIWLDRGIAGDDTHGHVDDIARFVGEETIVTVAESDTHDENYAIVTENLARLKAARTLNGKQRTIVELPLPRAVVFDQRRLPASYANFYIANNLVLVPTFHDVHDRVALNTLAQIFPDREVIGIHCTDFIWGLGAMHCMTQQQPVGLPTGLSK